MATGHPGIRRRAAAVASGVLAAAAAAAQPLAAAAQGLPGPADPSRVEERIAPQVTPQSRPSLVLEGPDFEPPPSQAFAIRFDLSDVVLEGVAAYPPGAFDELFAPLRGTSVSLLDVYRVRDAITTRYRTDGYVLSQAIIPAQRVERGVVRITVVEGFVNEVLFEGDVPDAAERFAGYAARIKASRPLRLDVLERALLVMDDLPGIAARTVLRPAEGVTGGTDLVFVLERQLFRGQVGANNRGSRAIGPYQADAYAEANSIEGRLAGRVVAAVPLSELVLGDLSYSHWIGEEGASLTFGVRRNLATPGVQGRPKVDSVTSSVRVGGSYPLLRSRAETLRLGLELSMRESVSTLRETSTRLTQDRLPTATASATYDFADDGGGTNVLQLSYTVGLQVLGATQGRLPSEGRPGTSRADGRSDFWRVNVVAERRVPLTEAVGAVVSLQGQYTRMPLLASEEFGIGGSSIGLAYDPSEITGDIGWGAKLELNRVVELPGLPPVQAFWYADHGRVRNWRAGTGAAGGQNYNWTGLTSFGFGTRFSFGGALSGSLLAAKPMSDHEATGNNLWRLFFTVAASF